MTEKTELFSTGITDDEKGDISSVDETSLTEDEFQLINKKHSRNPSQTSINSIHSTRAKVENETSIEKVERLITDEDSEEVNEIMYGQESHNKAINNLVLFSILLLVVPLASVFISYQYFLYKRNLPKETATLYAGIVGAAFVYFIVATFIWIAYKEEKIIFNKAKILVNPKKIN